MVDHEAPTPKRRRDATDILIRVGHGMNRGLGTGPLLDHMLDALLELTEAQRGLVVFFGHGDQLAVTASRGLPAWNADDDTSLVTTVVQSVVASGVALRVADASTDRHFAQCDGLDAPLSVLALPLWRNPRETLGVIYAEADEADAFEAGLDEHLAGLAELMAVVVSDSRRHEDELRTVYDAAPSGLVVLDENGNLRRANRAALRLLDCEGDACIGKPVASMVGDAGPALEELMDRVGLTDRAVADHIVLTRPDGNQRHVETHFVALPPSEEGGRRLLILEDQTERQRLLSAAAQREKMAAVGMLAAGVAHEFNNIWAAVHGFAELATQRDEFKDELVEVVLQQADRASDIVRNLLSFSEKKAEGHRPLQLSVVLRDVARLVRLELGAQAIELRLDLGDDPAVLGNESQLQQIFLNLVINASHAIGHKGAIQVGLTTADGLVLVRIADDGRGMTPEEVNRVFVPFYTTKGALGGSAQADGRGLGLTLTYNLVLAHGGAIDVESTPGQGSAFTITLPLAPQEVEVREEETGPSTLPPADACEVLVVDDELLMHDLLRATLMGHHVTAVATAEEALSLLSSRTFDAVFLDLVLSSEMTGLDVEAEMRTLGLTTPAILMTGRPDTGRMEGWRKRFAAVIRKPFSIETVREALASAIKLA